MIAFLGFGGSLALFILQILGVISISGWLIALPALVVVGLVVLNILLVAVGARAIEKRVNKW